MSKWLIVIALFLPAAATAATVWTWVGENGVRHYSDRPVEGAERIELAEAQGFAAPPASRVQPGAAEQQQPAELYDALRITQPEPNETLWNIEGTLEVGVEVEPPLREGHEIDLYLDGERQYVNNRRGTFTVEEVWRGVHSLEAVVVDGTGSEITRSGPINFVVQQTSLLNSNNPNTSPQGVN